MEPLKSPEDAIDTERKRLLMELTTKMLSRIGDGESMINIETSISWICPFSVPNSPNGQLLCGIPNNYARGPDFSIKVTGYAYGTNEHIIRLTLTPLNTISNASCIVQTSLADALAKRRAGRVAILEKLERLSKDPWYN